MISKLKLARLNAGMKQFELAAKLGITQSGLSAWELNKRRCPADTRYKIAEILGVEVGDIFSDEDKVSNV